MQLYSSYEQHRDYFGLSQIGGSQGATYTNSGSKDEGFQMVAVYYLADWKVTGQAERLKYAVNDTFQGAVDRYRRDAVWISVLKRTSGKSVTASTSITPQA